MKKLVTATHKSYIDDFIEVITDMGYKCKDVTFSTWCIWVTVTKKDGSEMDDVDEDIIKTVKSELRNIIL